MAYNWACAAVGHVDAAFGARIRVSGLVCLFTWRFLAMKVVPCEVPYFSMAAGGPDDQIGVVRAVCTKVERGGAKFVTPRKLAICLGEPNVQRSSATGRSASFLQQFQSH